MAKAGNTAAINTLSLFRVPQHAQFLSLFFIKKRPSPQPIPLDRLPIDNPLVILSSRYLALFFRTPPELPKRLFKTKEFHRIKPD